MSSFSRLSLKKTCKLQDVMGVLIVSCVKPEQLFMWEDVFSVESVWIEGKLARSGTFSIISVVVSCPVVRLPACHMCAGVLISLFMSRRSPPFIRSSDPYIT